MIRIQHDDFSLDHELKSILTPETGAVVSFIGTVRNFSSHGAVSAIELEHYPNMTEKSLLQIEAAAKARWDLHELLIVHRIGHIAAGEQIVLVVASSAHRHAAFEAASFSMDLLKTQALFWKKEWVDGVAIWVDAKETDQVAAAAWHVSTS